MVAKYEYYVTVQAWPNTVVATPPDDGEAMMHKLGTRGVCRANAYTHLRAIGMFSPPDFVNTVLTRASALHP